MKPVRASPFAGGPKQPFKAVGCPPPFALSLSKGQAETAFTIALSLSKEALGLWHEGFVKPSLPFDKLRANGVGEPTAVNMRRGSHAARPSP